MTARLIQFPLKPDRMVLADEEDLTWRDLRAMGLRQLAHPDPRAQATGRALLAEAEEERQREEAIAAAATRRNLRLMYAAAVAGVAGIILAATVQGMWL